MGCLHESEWPRRLKEVGLPEMIIGAALRVETHSMISPIYLPAMDFKVTVTEYLTDENWTCLKFRSHADNGVSITNVFHTRETGWHFSFDLQGEVDNPLIYTATVTIP